MSDFSFPSTGDYATDQELARRFRLHSERMERNVCPNGCAEMKWDYPYERHCEVCGFVGVSNVPYDMKSAQA
jgi:hypothetical protein